MSHLVDRLTRQPSEPGAALTAPALAHTYGRGASVSDRTCSIEGCAKPARARGWCSAHYQRWQRTGDPRPITPASGRAVASRGLPGAFIDQAVASATDECIIWPYAKNTGGYGHAHIDGRSAIAHRVVLERTAGPPPVPGLHAAHAPLICRNRACVNPRHLRWATPAQNNGDLIIDGVSCRGERHAQAKLTAVQVLAIFRDPRSHAAVAAEHGVSPDNIRSIKLGLSWGWLTHTSKAVTP